MDQYTLTHLDAIESEGIHIMREVAAQFQNPVLLFSGGKDSIAMLRLAEKAFHPARMPFPVMHVDTGHNFPEVLEFRDRLVEQMSGRLVVASVEEAIARGICEEAPGQISRNRLQSATLVAAIEEHKFDAAFGGGRRDEEKARAKERIFSFRDEFGGWDPKNQRPELWNLYNGNVQQGENIRVFPLSNWTELDVWQYLAREKVEIPNIYFTHRRRVFFRDDQWLSECDYLQPKSSEEIVEKDVRFRTVGDMVCTGAIESRAETIEEIIVEVAATRVSERGGRADDRFSVSAMEDRKKEGYF
ncbi:MAG: sulfate adenylyltransferase subunit CysD [Lentisphaeria bacterium]|jgi:sulfate adenylyltransferase subunit 2|nr:sulfate adenylyltransferase subunit CysD [Lentisphaeria bacterium]MDP7740391.1 sulfate adenylyltransferase subunit CysD [Lentisphaeria bacterium]